MEAVDNDASDVPFDGLLQFGGGLVAAVEVDPLSGEVDSLGHGKLPTGNHVQPQTLGGEYLGYGGVYVCLAGVCHKGVRMTLGELANKAAANAAESHFVKDVERGAEFSGQINSVAAANDQMSGIIDV